MTIHTEDVERSSWLSAPTTTQSRTSGASPPPPPPPDITEGRAERESVGMPFSVHGQSKWGVEYFKINFAFHPVINSLES